MAIRQHVHVAVLAAVLVVVVATLAVTRGSSGSDAEAPRTSSPTASASGSERAGGTPAPTAAPTGPAAAPAAPGSTAGAEMPTDATDATDAAFPGLPGAARTTRVERASKAELRERFPALRTARGALVAGHPRHTVPVPAGAQVRSSSLATEEGITQVGVVARVAGSPAATVRHYRDRLGRAGFDELAAPPAPTGRAASFRRAADTVTLTARRQGTHTVLTVHATLRTGR